MKQTCFNIHMAYVHYNISYLFFKCFLDIRSVNIYSVNTNYSWEKQENLICIYYV